MLGYCDVHVVRTETAMAYTLLVKSRLRVAKAVGEGGCALGRILF